MNLKWDTVSIKKCLVIALCMGLPILVMMLPSAALPLSGLTWTEQRVLAIFLFAALCWVFEPIPIYATSICVLVLELLLISTHGLIWFRQGPTAQLGTLIKYQALMSTLASPVILLFLGGFFLAMAATKYRLDQNLANMMLRPLGQKPHIVMLGCMLITAVFSMFMSNTATTAMMLSLMVPILSRLDDDPKGKVAFCLCIPLAANIGGVGTPIGTPPNAIALKYLVGPHTISFGKWMLFSIPYVLAMLLIGWFLLRWLYPVKTEKISLEFEVQFLQTSKAWIVYLTFAGTILLWLTEALHGINTYIVALLPVGLFLATEVITKEELKRLNWDVLWLVAGGIALGMALEQSGLAQRVIAAIPFGSLSPYWVILLAALLATSMATFMSNTATANLLLPIVAILGTNTQSLAPLGGMKMLILCVAFSSSLGMALPISTPPNALAHAMGFIETRDMIKVGLFMGVIGLTLLMTMLWILNTVGFFAQI